MYYFCHLYYVSAFTALPTSIFLLCCNHIYDRGWTIRGSNPGRGKWLSSSPNRPDRIWGPFSPLLSGYWGSFPGVKRPERDVDYAPPSSARLRMSGAVTLTPRIRLHGVHRDSFTWNKVALIVCRGMYLCSCSRAYEVAYSSPEGMHLCNNQRRRNCTSALLINHLYHFQRSSCHC